MKDEFGVSLDVLSVRLQACDDKMKSKEWKYQSSVGFIAAGETLEGVILHDKKTMETIGVSRNDVVVVLRKFFCFVEKLNIVDVVEGVTYVADGKSKERKLRIEKRWFMSAQRSPFWVVEEENHKNNVEWNVEWLVEEQETNISCLISGDAQSGIISLIENFGFFEGGLEGRNEYRIDIFTLMFVLEGKYKQEAKEWAKMRYKCEMTTKQQQEKELEKEKEKYNKSDKEAMVFFEQQRQKLINKKEEIKIKMKKIE